MSKLDVKKVANEYVVALVVNGIVDAYIFMLSMGGIAHITHLMWLAFGFWLSLLIKLASTCVIPQEYMSTRILLKILEKL